MRTAVPLSDRLRDLAHRLQAEIDRKSGPREENTPKRAREAQRARHEAKDLVRTQRALRVLANAYDAGTVPEILSRVRTRQQVATCMQTALHAMDYYNYRSTDDPVDHSEAAQALRDLVTRDGNSQHRAAEAERRRRQQIMDLEQQVRFRAIPGFFPTPPPIIARMLAGARIQPGNQVLDPSAGKGDILDLACEQFEDRVALRGIEINPTLAEICRAKGHDCEQADFLKVAGIRPDRIVMNPPFERGQDLNHVRHAYDLLATGGRLVSVVSAGGLFRSDRQATEFRAWIEQVAAEHDPLPDDAFKSAFRSTGTRWHPTP